MDQLQRSGTYTLIQKSGFAPRRQYHINNIFALGGNVTNRTLPAPPEPLEFIRKSRYKPAKNPEQPALLATVGSNFSVQEKQPLSEPKRIKTPVSILQEFLNQRGISPTYVLVQIDGAIHEPTFRYQVSFNIRDESITAIGTGRSKKEAKQAAARALIEKTQDIDISSLANGSNIICPITCEANGSTIGSGDAADSVLGNPIGWLQEMCMSRHWPPPTYNIETEVGLPHERLFTIACSILNFREIGTGKSKKIAKREAAQKMWVRLKDNALDNEQINEAIQYDLNAEILNNTNFYSVLKNFSISKLTTEHGAKVSEFHKLLKSSAGHKLLKLQETCINNSFYDFIMQLAEIAKENQFEVTYVNVEEMTIDNMFQCLVQLSTLPVAVCHGIGKTAEEAQQQAAHNALEYLKIMTKRYDIKNEQIT